MSETSPFLSKPHPRLFFSPGQIAGLRAQVETDPVSQRIFRCVRQVADGFLVAPPCERVMEGRRLLGTSRIVLTRVLFLGLAALVSGEDQYARRAAREMTAAAGFTDWNPSHYLDVAEMTLGLAIGYDWLHDHLTADERDAIAAAIIEKGIRPSLAPGPETWWIDGHNNWNQVCHAGLAGGALAVAERDPALARAIVTRAVEKVPLAAHAYAPDGAYVEGTAYWGYGTAFHVMLIDMLRSAVGHDGGLASAPGFLASAEYLRQATGPGGEFFNYSDARAVRSLAPPLFWFANRLDAPGLLRAELAGLDETMASIVSGQADENFRLFPLVLLWWRPEFAARLDDQHGPPPLHWMARGPVPVGVHRTSWRDPHAAYIALKGGCPSAPHGHMDGGAFVLEAGGVRWAVDPGMQEYHSLEKFDLAIWDSRQESARWKVFRIGAEAHNILRFDAAPQLIDGKVPLVRFGADGEWPHTVVDLSAIYADRTTRVWRGVALRADGRFLLQDEWTARDESAVEVRWQMLTFANVSVEEKRIALSQGNQKFILRVLAPADAVIEVTDVSAPAQPYDAPNPGLRKIVVRTRTASGRSGVLRLQGALAAAADEKEVPARPLADWSAPLAMDDNHLQND